MSITSSASDDFKRPDKPAPRKRKKVLDEDSYVKELEKIIERDFFPDLRTLKERGITEANDDKRREFYRKNPALLNVHDSPATFETPESGSARSDLTPLRCSENLVSSDDVKDTTSENMPETTSNLSLDEFLENHTSEDNESFEKILANNERRFRMKHAWMFDAEEKHNEEHTPNLALPTIEQREQASRQAITGTSAQNDTRPKQVENWKFNTFNSVMFVPDGVQSQAKAKREVVLKNTRFNMNPFTETLSQKAMLEASAVQASKKEGKVGVDGKELGKDSPKVNGYSFVTAPSPAPGVDASPLMTWGEVDGTPLQLDGSQTPLLKKHTPGPSYRIPKVPNRDRLGHMLAEQVNQKHRSNKDKAISLGKSNLGTPLSKLGLHSSSERMNQMSPAAQKLLSTKLGIQRGTDKALRQSYTPSPSTRSSSNTPKFIRDAVMSPLLCSPKRQMLSKNIISKSIPNNIDKEVPGPDLTDNLLDLPKRQKISNKTDVADSDNARKSAADFF